MTDVVFTNYAGQLAVLNTQQLNVITKLTDAGIPFTGTGIAGIGSGVMNAISAIDAVTAEKDKYKAEAELASDELEDIEVLVDDILDIE